MSTLKQILKALTPYGLVERRRRLLFSPSRPVSTESDRLRFHAARRAAISASRATPAADRALIDGENRDEVVAFLESRQIPLHHILEGSVPEASLAFLRQQIQNLPISDEIPIGLHIGNFVGVSLAFLTAALRRIHPEALVIAVDPNLRHRDVAEPQNHVAALLRACGLQHNVLMVAGYSGAKSISNDGVTFGDYDPAQSFQNEAACEASIANLRKLFSRRCLIALIDGNHEANYLEREITEIMPLMRSGGLLVFDDVDEHWAEIRELFARVRDFGLEPLAANGRLGIAQVG